MIRKSCAVVKIWIVVYVVNVWSIKYKIQNKITFTLYGRRSKGSTHCQYVVKLSSQYICIWKYLRSVCRKIHLSRIRLSHSLSLSLSLFCFFLSRFLCLSHGSFYLSLSRVLTLSFRPVIIVIVFWSFTCSFAEHLRSSKFHIGNTQRVVAAQRERRTFDSSFSLILVYKN